MRGYVTLINKTQIMILLEQAITKTKRLSQTYLTCTQWIKNPIFSGALFI